MIDIRTEQLLPLKDLPDYMVSRGFGKRVTMRAVNRWIREGCNGVELEVVRIDKAMLTSLEAVQRWVEAQTLAPAPPRSPTPVLPPPTTAPATTQHVASVHLLVENRVISTDLDRAIRSLKGHARSTLAYTAGALFRAGLRHTEDVRKLRLVELMSIHGLGPQSAPIAKQLWEALNGVTTTMMAQTHQPM